VIAVDPDEAFAFEVQNDFLCRFLRRQVSGVDHHLCILRLLIGIRNAGEFLQDPSPRFRVQTFAIALFAGFDGRGDVDQNESTNRFDHIADVLASGIVWRDGCANGDAAILGDFRSHIADAADINVAVLLGEAEFRGEMLANQVSVEQRDRPAAGFEELGD